jgi:hypothetical protein
VIVDLDQFMIGQAAARGEIGAVGINAVAISAVGACRMAGGKRTAADLTTETGRQHIGCR